MKKILFSILFVFLFSSVSYGEVISYRTGEIKTISFNPNVYKVWIDGIVYILVRTNTDIIQQIFINTGKSLRPLTMTKEEFLKEKLSNEVK